jgi:hypothetical protein
MDRKSLETTADADGGIARHRRRILIAGLLLACGAPPLRAQASGDDGYRPAPRLPYRYPLPDPTPAPASTPQTARAQTVQAQPVDRTEATLERAGQIAVQPVRDVGIARATIPLVLQEAVQDPYKPLHRQNCAWVDYELARLNQALGTDFGPDRKANEDRATELALLGGEMVVNSLIPFRGIVREISGAGPADRRKAAAVNAGLARRGYVRGIGMALNCPVRITTASK